MCSFSGVHGYARAHALASARGASTSSEAMAFLASTCGSSRTLGDQKRKRKHFFTASKGLWARGKVAKMNLGTRWRAIKSIIASLDVASAKQRAQPRTRLPDGSYFPIHKITELAALTRSIAVHTHTHQRTCTRTYNNTRAHAHTSHGTGRSADATPRHTRRGRPAPLTGRGRSAAPGLARANHRGPYASTTLPLYPPAYNTSPQEGRSSRSGKRAKWGGGSLGLV